MTNHSGGGTPIANEDIAVRLRKRAEIRRKATCRGPEDRLANDLDEAASEIERLRSPPASSAGRKE